MVRKKISEFLLYRLRYSIAFASLIVILLIVLVMVGKYIPGGLSETEMKSATSSIHTPILAVNGDEVAYLLNLPYHLLQKLSIMLFGVQFFAIKLPSLILAFMSAVALYGLLRLWFQRNTSVATSLIAITSAQFLFLAQLGTPEIAYLFWPAILLFATSMIAYSEKYTPVWVSAAAVAGALSLYTPLMVYLVFALAATCLIHPHARFVVFRQPKIVLILSGAIFISLLTPIILGAISSPTILATLFGFTSATISMHESLQYISNYIQLNSPSIGASVAPIYSLVVLLLITIGVIRLVTTKYTAKSYILSILFVFLAFGAMAGILPATFTFIPAMVLVAFAINYIIRSWYQLFPLNPYARIFGLLPIVVLLAGISLSEIDRYVYGVQYSTEAQTFFQKDVKLLRNTIIGSNESFLLLTSESKLRFYTDLAERTPIKNGYLIVTSNKADAVAKSATHTIIVAPELVGDSSTPSEVIVSSNSSDSVRFYLYKNSYK